MRKLLITLCLLYCSLISAQKNITYDSIKSLIQSYQYKQAIELINNQLNTGSRDVALYQLKGLAYKSLLKYPEAIYAYEKAVSMDSSNYQTYIDLGFCCKSLGNYNKALESFVKANSLKPENISISMEIAGIYISMEDNLGAVKIYKDLFTKDTTNIFLMRSIGKVYENLDMNDSASVYYAKAVQLNAYDMQSVIRLASIYIKLNKSQEAMVLTDHYRIKDRINAKVNRLNAYSYFLVGKYRISIQKFQKCLDNSDTVEFNFRQLGMGYFRIEKYDSAKIYLEKSLQKDTLNAQTCYALGIVCKMLNLNKEGIAYFNRTIELTSPSPKLLSEVLQHMSEAYNNCNQYNRGLASLLEAKRVNPTDTLLKFRIATQYDGCLKNRRLATKYYREFLSTRPAPSGGTNKNKKASVASYYEAAQKRLDQFAEELRVAK
jgi:tetratricopeptide (TPR) repeat protein